MADVSNSFEGGTNATTITTGNSGGGSGNAFGHVAIVTGGSATYTTTAYRGTLAGRFASAATAGITYCEYTTAVGAASTGQVYGRMRFQLPALPPDATGVRVAIICDSTGSFRAELRVTNAGAVSIRGSGGTALATFTDTYVAGTWWDVGLAILVFSTTVGQIEAKKYAANGTVSQTITSAANQNTTGAGGANKLQAGMIRSMANFVVILDDVAWSTTAYPNLAVAATPAISYGPWTGGVTDTAVKATYVMTSTATARLVVSASDTLSSPTYSSAVAPDADGVVQLAVTGLTPGTQYYYGVEADGTTLLAGGRGEFKTFPEEGTPANFSVAFGSCQFNTPSDSTFAAIMNKTGVAGRALQLIHMGDMHYQDFGAGTTAAQVYAQYMASLSSASMAPMLSKVPINYIWDNHDWGGDTSDKNADAGPVVAATYRKVFPTYPLEATDGRGAYHSWVVGRVRFIQLDVRAYRDPQSQSEAGAKTMLGTEQKAWFKARLLDPEPLKIVCGVYPWRDDGDGTGRWGSYSTEFTELSDYIDANVAGKVYVIFGDRHYLAADDGTSTGTRGIPQVGGAPFQQATVAVSGTWSQGSYTQNPAVVQAFGWLDVTDDGEQIVIDYAGITSLDGTTRVAMTTAFDTDGDEKFASAADALTLADTVQSTTVLKAAAADGLQLADGTAQSVARLRALADDVNLVDAASRAVMALARGPAEGLNLADAQTAVQTGLLSSITDVFGGDALSDKWVLSHGNVGVLGGKAFVECGPGFPALQLKPQYQLDSFYIEAFPAAAAGATTEASTGIWIQSPSVPGGTDIGFLFDMVNNVLSLRSRSGYFDGDAVDLAYDPVAHAWLRLRIVGGNALWDTSPNGVTWTNQRTATAPAWVVTATDVRLLFEAHRSDGTTNQAYFDNLSVSSATSQVAAAADTLALSDIPAVGISLQSSAGEPLALADTPTSLRAILAAVAQALNLADAAGIIAGRGRGAADSITLADTPTRPGSGRARTSADAVQVTDAADRAVNRGRAVPEAVQLADAPARQLSRGRDTADAVVLGNGVARGAVVHARAVPDLVQLVDAVGVFQFIAPALAFDSLTLSPSAGRRVAAARAVTDVLELADEVQIGAPPPIAHNHFVEMTVTAGVVEYTAGPGI